MGGVRGGNTVLMVRGRGVALPGAERAACRRVRLRPAAHAALRWRSYRSTGTNLPSPLSRTLPQCLLLFFASLSAVINEFNPF